MLVSPDDVKIFKSDSTFDCEKEVFVVRRELDIGSGVERATGWCSLVESCDWVERGDVRQSFGMVHREACNSRHSTSVGNACCNVGQPAG